MQRKFCKLFANNPSKEICTFLVFLTTHQVLLKFAKHFAYLKWHGQGLYKNVLFLQICNFFADSKSRAQELSNDVSFVIFRHQTWDLEGGQIAPPPSISWFSITPAGIGLTDAYS